MRSVKASNLRPGHVLHHRGQRRSVGSKTDVSSALNGDRVRVVADGDTIHFNPEERVSVSTETVETAVQEGLRDAAASRARWARWEATHGKARGLTGYHHSGEGEEHVGSMVRVKGSGYHGDVVKSHGGGSYSVKLARGSKATMAGPNRPQTFSHDKLEVLPKDAHRHEQSGHTFVSGKDGLVHPDDYDVARGLPGIVERHDGTLYVQSRLPKGAAVRGKKVEFPGDPKQQFAPSGGDLIPNAGSGGGGTTTVADLRSLGRGGAMTKPGGVEIERTATGWTVHGAKTKSFTDPADALRHANRESRKGVKAGRTISPRTKPGRISEEDDVSTAVEEAVSELLEASKRKPLSDAVKRPGQLHRDLGVPEDDKIPVSKIRDAAKNHKDPKVRKRANLALTFKKVNEAQEVGPDELAEFEVAEAADSLRKASTPEPFSRSKTSNWVARVGGLPNYIQHIAHDLMEKRGKSESNAIQIAVGVVKRWCKGGGKVDATTRAAACKASAEWEAKKARSHAQEAAIMEALETGADRELIVAEAEWLAADEQRELREAWTDEPVQEVDKGEPKPGDMPKVKCPKCHHTMKPTEGGKCSNCGHDVKALAKVVTKIRSKTQEGSVEERLATVMEAAFE